MISNIPEMTTAIDLIVEDVAFFVDPYREKYCHSQHGEMPPHITLLFPFINPKQLNDKVIDDLKKYFINIKQFDYKLDAVAYFPGVAYLSPNPNHHFIEIMKGLMSMFPESQPYGCDFIEPPPPHLTFAKSSSEVELKNIANNFLKENKDKLNTILTFSNAHITFVENGISTPTIKLPLMG